MEIQIPSPSVFLRSRPELPTAASNDSNTVTRTHGCLSTRYSVTSAPGSETGVGTRVKQSKSRNGCLSCKKKRLKCDETKPICVQCQKRNVACAGYQKDYKWRTFEEMKARCKPIAMEKNLRPHPSASTQNPHQTLNVIGASNDGVESNTLNLRHGGMDDLRPSTTWPPMLHLTSGIVIPERSGQHQGQGSTSCSQFQALSEATEASSSQFHTTSHSILGPPANDENSLQSLSFYEHVEPFKLDESTAESSAADTSSAKSFLSHSPQSFDPPSEGSISRSTNPPEHQPPVSPLPCIPLTFEAIRAMDRSSEGRLIGPNAVAGAAGLTLAPISTFFKPSAESAWRAPRIYSPSPSIASGSSSDSNDMVIHGGPSSNVSSPEMLMLRFDQETCSILSIKDGPTENPWRTLIWPWARECSALYHAISSMTAFHGAHDNPMLYTPGMAHMTKSMRRLASEIENMRLDYALATSLALAFSEGWESHVSTGVQHLRAARVMVKNLMIKHRQDEHLGNLSCEDAGRIKFLCNTFVYMDVVARLTSFEEASETNYEEILMTVNGPCEDQMEVDPLMGCAMTLFPLIGRVASLIQRVYKSESNTLNMVSTAMELKEQIEKWQLPSPTMFEKPEDPNSEVQHSIQTAEAYRYATLLYLHQAIPEIPSESAQSLAKKVLFKLASVPLSSGAIIVQIFPLFAASCEITGPDDRSWVTQRWAAMTARLRIGNIKSCWGVVQEVWNRRDVFENEKANRILRRYKSRGFPGESLVPPIMQIPSNLKRKVCTIDSANARGIVYEGSSQGKSRLQQNEDAICSSESWRSTAREELQAKAWPSKRPTVMKSNSSGLSTSLPAVVGGGGGFTFPSTSFGQNRVRRTLNDTTSPNQVEFEYTVRGQLHWLSVMAEWRWEVFL